VPKRQLRPPGLATGDVVVVTGASRGIGAEICRRFSALGCSVGLIGRDASALADVEATLSSPSHAAVADVADSVALARAINDIVDLLGAISVLVNNAGHGSWTAVVDTDASDFRRAIDVNYLGVVAATALVLPEMLERRRGHIINISSIAGRIGAPFEAAYTASKFAMVGFSEALAIEVAATRGRPAPRRAPKPVPVEAVGDAVMATVRRPRHNRYVPAWLGYAVAAKTIAPRVYRFGTARLFADDRRQLRERFVTDQRLDKEF
jgi:3-oxoacyl-[acyl-carrier protein] reductase